MSENKRRFKLIPPSNYPYAPTQNNWAFVSKIKGGYKVLHRPLACKDYIHEGLSTVINKSVNFTNIGVRIDTPINLENFQIVMFFYNNYSTFKSNLYSIKKYINSLEKNANIKQTSIVEVDSGFANVNAFVLTADKAYIESPGLHHALVAMMRTLHYAKTSITKTNIQKVLEGLAEKDYQILRFVLEHKIYDLLLNNHDRIAKLKLNEVYPPQVDNIVDDKKVNTYHSGFGMVAVCTRKMSSKAYSDEVIKILNENNIPILR